MVGRRSASASTSGSPRSAGGELAGLVALRLRARRRARARLGRVARRPARPGAAAALGKRCSCTVFGELARLGRTAAGLSVHADNPTGAVRLYESVGMRPVSRRRSTRSASPTPPRSRLACMADQIDVSIEQRERPPPKNGAKHPNTCPKCDSHYRDDELEATLYVCGHCGHHFPVPARERIAQLADAGLVRRGGGRAPLGGSARRSSTCGRTRSGSRRPS